MFNGLDDEDIEVLTLKKGVDVRNVDITGVVVDFNRRVLGGFQMSVLVLKNFDVLTLPLICAKCPSNFLDKYLLPLAFLNVLILLNCITAGSPKLLEFEFRHRLFLNIRLYLFVEVFFFLTEQVSS